MSQWMYSYNTHNVKKYYNVFILFIAVDVLVIFDLYGKNLNILKNFSTKNYDIAYKYWHGL